jgi:exoribonuclease R
MNGAICAKRWLKASSDHIRLAYEQVDALFESGLLELDSEIKTALAESRKLSSLLSRKRMDAGYIFFDLPEIEFHYDSEGFLHKMSLAEETESHKMIENFMLVANEYTAKKLAQVSPTVMYRIHEDPDWEKLEKHLRRWSMDRCKYQETPTRLFSSSTHNEPDFIGCLTDNTEKYEKS